MKLARDVAALLFAAVLLSVLAGCGGSDAGEAESGTAEQSDALVADHGLPVVEIPTRWAVTNAADLRTLARSSDAVFVGTVVELSGQYSEAPLRPPGDAGNATGPALREFPISMYSVTVETAVSGDVSAGTAVTIEQAGGVSTRSDGSQVRLALEEDEPLTVGARYLFFASAKHNGSFTSPPFGRFEVNPDGSLTALPDWLEAPAVVEVTGLGVDAATREVASAVSE